MLSVPAPTRIPFGTLQIGGQKFDLFVSPEWARYFQTLNTQVQANGASAALGSFLAGLLGQDQEQPDAFPALPGPPGNPGEPGLALFMLQDASSEDPILVPPSASAGMAGSFSTISASAGFGCNGKAPQAPVASGGTLAGVIAALVANGILSS